MKIAVYTVITGTYDVIKFVEQREFVKEADFYLFSNSQTTNYQYRTIPIRERVGNPRIISRKYKFLSHKYLPDYDYHIYIDGSTRLNESPLKLIEKYMAHSAIATFKHPYRSTIFEEIEFCIQHGHFKRERIGELLREIEMSGYPRDFVLRENSVIIRKNKPYMRAFNDFCWATFREYPYRDQIFFCYALWKFKIKSCFLDNYSINSTEFILHPHT
jgi:hypothetical protein